MRIQPIEKPNSIMMRIAHWFCKRKLGKVITPMKVICARVPASLGLYRQLGVVADTGFTIPAEQRLLITTHIASINGCGFCIDISRAFAATIPGLLDKLAALPNYHSDPRYTEADRAMLDYCVEVTETKKASDETFTRLKEHFNDTQIIEITMMNAIENFYNLQNGPLQIESDGLCLVPQPKQQSAVA